MSRQAWFTNFAFFFPACNRRRKKVIPFICVYFMCIRGEAVVCFVVFFFCFSQTNLKKKQNLQNIFNLKKLQQK